MDDVESFNGRLREECLNETLLCIAHAREVLAIFYNTVRPHSGLSNLAPSIYGGLSAPKMQRDGTLRYTEGSKAPRPIPLQHRAIKAQINPELYPSLDERRGSGQSDRKSRLQRWFGPCGSAIGAREHSEMGFSYHVL
jgi:hypothetical protein